jgi:hypothetical protein
MRKLLWCCVAAGAATVCGAFWTAAYVSQNPDSAIGRCALAACPAAVTGAVAAGPNNKAGTADGDDLVPADPVEVDDPPPPPTPGSSIPPEVAALMAPPPIVIHDDVRDEEDLNAAAGPSARTDSSTTANVGAGPALSSTIDIGGLARRVDDEAEPRQPSGPPAMPYCTEEDGTAPLMPYCTDDDAGKVVTASYRPFDAGAFWMGFFSGPSHIFGDAAQGRCEEDAHYPQQYSGCPYTGESSPAPAQPAHTELKPAPAFPGADEPSEPPAPKADKHADPSELFAQPRRPKMPQSSEPQSDTMEMRPSDWKPYSLDPGPF